MDTFIFYTPFTGLGLYNGFRGNRWLRNRIKIFKQFVIPSLINQTDRDFVHWISWRQEEKDNPYVKELEKYLKTIPNYRFVFTYEGVCFWDDKYPDEIARERLFNSLRLSLPSLLDLAPTEHVYMMLQPSDDLYDRITVESARLAFRTDDSMQAITYLKGYIMNYNSGAVLEYNPNTNPPFFVYKFPRKTFFDAGRHMTYISLKEDAGPYKAGTPQPSHEYLPRCLKTAFFDGRGFLVGTHGENISTHFNHPFGGAKIVDVDKDIVLENFGIRDVPLLKLPKSFRKWLMRRLPFKWQKKLRYWWGERLYNFIRS